MLGKVSYTLADHLALLVVEDKSRHRFLRGSRFHGERLDEGRNNSEEGNDCELHGDGSECLVWIAERM